MFEKLHRRADSACETPSGLLAVKMRVRSGTAAGTSWFEFKQAVLGPIQRVEWSSESDLCLIAPDIARYLVLASYATGITDEELEEHNKAVDEANSGSGTAPTPVATTSTVKDEPQVAPKWTEPKASPVEEKQPEKTTLPPSIEPTEAPTESAPLKASGEPPAAETPSAPEDSKATTSSDDVIIESSEENKKPEAPVPPAPSFTPPKPSSK